MSDSDGSTDGARLQFDRAVARSDAAANSGETAVTCSACRASIPDEYYDINANVVCARCRTALEAAAQTPAGVGPLAIAAACGFFAAIAGAIIYYVVLDFAHLEIGFVAILIGYMVGYSVRKGARGGGLRFQILAVLLTYMAVAFAYVPIVIRGAINAQNARGNDQQVPRATGGSSSSTTTRGEEPKARVTLNPRAAVFAVTVLAGFTLALPVIAIFSAFPSGLISAFIIFIGLRQAWRMTGAPFLQVLGPYRVGASGIAIRV